MKKGIIISLLVTTLVLGSSVMCFADTNELANSESALTVSEDVVNEDSEEEIATTSVGEVMFEVVHLTAWLSHKNYHTSYTETVVRQGKKYKVTYVAAPRKTCPYCEIKSY